MCAPCERVRRGSEAATLARIIHECRREAFETEARRGFSQVRLGDWLRRLRRCLSRCSSDTDRRQKEGRQSPAVRRGGRTRKTPPGGRIGRGSRYS